MREHSGFSLAESMVSLVIVALAISMLAIVLSAAGRSILSNKESRQNNEKAIDAYVTDTAAPASENSIQLTSKDGKITIDCKLNTYEYEIDDKTYRIYDFSR